MSIDRNPPGPKTVVKTRTDFTGAALVLGIFACVILFIGEPDLHDAWIDRLGSSATAPQPSASPATPPAPGVVDTIRETAE